ncbi:AEC family transporter [Candidatus Mycalebacterium sp.]
MPDLHFPFRIEMADAGIAHIILPVFLVVAVGFLFGKIKRVDISPINDLVLYIAAPCLIFWSFSSPPMDFHFVVRIFGFFAAVSALCLIAGLFLTKILKLSRPAYLPTIIFANNGNMGLPLILFAFGEEGFQIAVVCMVAMAFIHYTVGVALVSPRGAVSEILKLPLIYSAIGGMWMNFGGYETPVFLDRAISLLADIAVPGMMFVLGYRLSEISISSFWVSSIFGCSRIVLGFFAAVALVPFFSVSDLSSKVMILQSTMPTAVTCLVLAEKYGAEPEKVASVIAVGTAVSFIVLPSMIFYLIG